MSFREKSAWISLVLILLIFGAYFWNVAGVVSGAADPHRGVQIQFGLVGAFIVLQIILHLAIAIRTPKEALAPRDERERLIDMKATRIAFPVLVIGALAAVGLMHVTRSAWMISQHALMAVVVAYAVKFGTQIVHYRRGV